MTGFFDPITLIFVAITVVVVWRLWSVLGTKTGYERPPFDPYSEKSDQAKPPQETAGKKEEADDMDQEPAKPVWTGYAEAGSELAHGLEDIAEGDPSFSPKAFLEGAKIAYEIVLDSFAKGDKARLKTLLNSETYAAFANAIDQRNNNAQRMEFQFIGFDKAQLKKAELDGHKAIITVSYSSQMLSAVYDKEGNLIEGEVGQVSSTDDDWQFERDLTQRNPNWLIIATDAA